MHDLVLLFKYKTGTVTSNFERFIHTATRHYRTRNFHQANFDLLSRHNQEYYCNSYFPRTVKLWNSLPNILKSSQDFLWFRVHLYEHFGGLLQTYSPPWFVNYFPYFFFFFSSFFFPYYVNLILFFFEPRRYVAIGALSCSSLRSRHTTVMIMYVFLWWQISIN